MRTKLAKRYMAILRGPLTVEWTPTFYQFISMFHAVRNIVKPVLPPKMLTCCSNHNRQNMLGKKTTSETVGVAPKPLNRSTRTHSGARYKTINLRSADPTMARHSCSGYGRFVSSKPAALASVGAWTSPSSRAT